MKEKNLIRIGPVPAAGIIFDMDGVLLDSTKIWQDTPGKYLRETFGLESPPDLGARFFALTVPQAAEYLIREYRLGLTVEEVTEGVRETILRSYRTEIPLKPGAGELLRLLKDRNIPTTLATTSSRSMAETAFARLGIASGIDRIFTVDEVGYSKQHPQIFQACAQYMGSPVEQTVLIEDALHSITTASKAGFRTVGVFDEASAQQRYQIAAMTDLYVEDLFSLIDKIS